MIIDNKHLLDNIFSASNEPSSDEDVNFYNKYEDGFVNYINLNDSYICGYLSRNVKNFGIFLSRLTKDEHTQLIEVVKKCDRLNRINFNTSVPQQIDNTELDALLNNKNMTRIVFQKNGMIDYDYLFTILDKMGDKTVIEIPKFYTEEQELKYLKLSSASKSKISVSNFSKQVYQDIFNAQRLHFITPSLYFGYKEFFDGLSNFNIKINNVSELGFEQLNKLKSDSRINGIKVCCGYEHYIRNYVYSIQEYENILLEIYDITSKIRMPDANNINREKIIFTQLYKILGERIVYDHYAISDEGKKDRLLAIECRNLKNGLLGVQRNGKKEYMCVCAGYATILQNICAVLGIKCDYIHSHSPEKTIPGKFDFSKNRKITYENGTDDPKGHAYVGVELDGQSYFCDLTWDSSMIRAHGVVCYYLISYDDFYANHAATGFSDSNVEVVSMDGQWKRGLDKNPYNKTASSDEIKMLFGYSLEETIEEMVNIGYLGGFVEEYISFVKTCKGVVELEDLKDILNVVLQVEECVLNSDIFKREIFSTAFSTDVVVKIGDEERRKRIEYYNSKNSTTKEYLASVEEMVKHARK